MRSVAQNCVESLLLGRLDFWFTVGITRSLECRLRVQRHPDLLLHRLHGLDRA